VAKVANLVSQDNAIVRYVRETRSELRKVIWPTREEATNLTIVVIAVTIGMAAVLGIIDFIYNRLFSLILR
jgi:preprotein translocase subunit SecE